MLRINNIYRGFGEKEVLKGVALTLKPSTITGLIGPSGGGKSILLKIIAHTCSSDAGSVEFEGGCGVDDVALMFQEGALFDSLSVYDNVAFPLVQGNVPTNGLPTEQREMVCSKVGEILARVGLTKAAYKLPGQLSGGMRRRVSLARALVSRPRILLLDDPTSGLDPVASSVIMELIVELHRDYKPITFIVSHDLRRLLPIADRIIALFDGNVAFDGSLDDLRQGASASVRSFVACRFELGTPSIEPSVIV